MSARLMRLVPLAGLLVCLLLTVFYLYRGSIGSPSEPGLRAPIQQNIDGLAHLSNTHHQVSSASTPDGKYFHIDFGEHDGFNPSIIPHPVWADRWYITAQLARNRSETEALSVWSAELVCIAAFVDEGRTLRCIEPALILPLAATATDPTRCDGELELMSVSLGPHDARIFYGPDRPYAVYGSNSQHTCFGQWAVDFRVLVDWPGEELLRTPAYRHPVELQRPLLPGYAPIEKNWFLFWDVHGSAYVHYDLVPTRAFSQLLSIADGSVGPDLAVHAAPVDGPCLQRYLPALTDPRQESIHQATNSLAVTLCERADPRCQPDEENTFVFMVFQHKQFVNFHSVYEPYVMLFRQREPFEVFGVSTHPIWIPGREASHATGQQSEMLYVTSLTWKQAGQRYHGFIDDVVFLAFGREDAHSGGIDVVARDLLDGLGYCVG
ncbi:uncharacterized protein BP01DRAFT_359139 [Aspergillus saccharolyticus JOP 1030-1]|uniref:Uncharacterized protein n=1 Tax=Aspergillus saccharolyticus JOP 1030-1 TaxID=1450539 RepID=A0A318ZS57_9EURO|nr:hypothetical protein BP01DRAFT_359139 [Aspergillus saccharolyticus JOP 1030-1]PYH42918.1 hypothetical protein BP01DRAFT_359139 [Aspergillus saccharolyticus JOP 1030-1]